MARREVNMKIKAIENYFDLKLKKQIVIGDEYEVSPERAKELGDKKLVEFLTVYIGEEIEDANRKTVSKSKKVQKG